MTIGRQLVTVVIVALAVGVSTPARAQIAEAETLFREGKRLMKDGEFVEACKKLDASDRLEPSAGTELNLADCRTKTGEIATAWGVFVKAAASAKRVHDDKKEAEARRRAAELEPQLVYLTIKVPDDVRVDGLVIKRNKTVIDTALWDQRMPIDPGEYKLAAEAPGYEPWTESVTITTKNRTIRVPALDPSETDPDAPKKPKHHRDPDPDDDDGGDGDGDTGRGASHDRRFTAVTVTFAVIGGAAIVGGIAFASAASSLENESDAICPDVGCGDPHGVDLNSRARRDALFANIGFGVGGAALVGAAIFLFSGSPSHPARVSVVPTIHEDGVGFAVGGRF